jgi:hypothetical protein
LVVVDVCGELKTIDQTAEHFRWPAILVTRALAYAKAFPEETQPSSEGERHGVSVAG